MLDFAGLSLPFWVEAATHSAYICNGFCSPGRNDATSYQLLIGHKLRIDRLRVFECHGWVLIPKQKRKTFYVKSGDG